MTIKILCPTETQGNIALLEPAELTEVTPMTQTVYEYDISSKESLEDDLAKHTLTSKCQNITKSYIVDSITHGEVDFITADWNTQRFSLYTEDADRTLRGQTIEFTWMVELTDGEPAKPLATFVVFFKSDNNLPLFEPELTSLMQIYRQPSFFLWTYPLPAYSDLDEDDTVTLTVDLGDAGEFMSYLDVEKMFEIADLSDPEVPTGEFKVSVTISDGKDTIKSEITVIVYDKPPESVAEEAEANVDIPTLDIAE